MNKIAGDYHISMITKKDNKTINFIKKCLDILEPKELVQIS